MRILVLVTEAYGGRGGIAQYGRDLLSALSEHPGCVEVVAIPRIVHGSPEEIPGKVRQVVPAGRGLAGFALAVRQAMRAKPGFDLVVCGHVNLLPIAWACGLYRARAPVLLVIYGIDAWRPRKRLLNNRLLGGVDAVVSISRATLRRFLAWSGFPEQKTHVLPNAIRLEQYGPAPKPRYLLERYGLAGKQVLLTVGRLVAAERYKGFDEVLECLPAVLRTHPDIRYLIAGDGDDRGRLEAKAASLGIADRVVFCGWIRDEERSDHYRVADAFVMPGRGEGFGFVYLEAMACGIPVVGSTLDGSREALRDGALGILVNPDDPAELEAGILQALARPRAVPAGLDYFAYPRFVGRVQALVEKVLAKEAVTA